MILQRMTEEELGRIAPLIQWQVPIIADETGISRKLVNEVLLVSTFLLTKEKGKTVMPLDDYIHMHCQRVASDLGVSYYDVQQAFGAQVELLIAAAPGKEAQA